MKIYHIDRNFGMTLEEQKKNLKKQHRGFKYLFSDGRKVHFMAED